MRPKRPSLGKVILFTLGLLGTTVLWAHPSEDKARRHFQNRQFDKVTSTLKLPLDKLSINSLKMLSRAHQEQANWSEAQRVLEYLKVRLPKDHLVSLNLARVHMAQDHIDEGLLEYKRTTTLRPQFLTAYEEQLQHFEKAERFSDMRSLLTDMLAHFGESKEVVFGLCRSYFEDGYVEQSKSYCQKALLKDDTNPSAYVYLGLTHKNSGDTKAAGEWIGKASSRFPASEIAQWAAGELEMEKGNFLGAERFLLKAQAAEPESLRVLKSLAEVQFQLGKYDEALAQYTKWCEIEKRVPDEFKKASGLLLTEKPEWHRKYNSKIAFCNS